MRFGPIAARVAKKYRWAKVNTPNFTSGSTTSQNQTIRLQEMSLGNEVSPPFLLQTPCNDDTSKDARAAPRSASAAGSLGKPGHEIDAADEGNATVPGEVGSKKKGEEHRLLGDIESIQVG